MRGEEGGLRVEIVRLRRELEEASKRETKLAESEEEMRAELAKARGTVERTNNQLAELDKINCELRNRAEIGQEDVDRTGKELEETREALEQARLEQGKLGELVDRLQAGKEENRREQRVIGEKNEELELNEMTRSEGGLVAVTKEVAEASVMVNACRECSPALSGRLAEAAAQLSLLSSVICGGEDDHAVKGELLRCESEECLVQEEERTKTQEREKMDDVERGMPSLVMEEEEEMLGSQLAELPE